MRASKIFIIGVITLSVVFIGKTALAETSQSSLYVPLIGITSVPQPLSLPKEGGNVTYKYAVKNLLGEISLEDIRVTDNICQKVEFITGDDNNNTQLDYGETWRYSCTVHLSQTTESTATVTGKSNGIIATHSAYATVAVGLDSTPPLVSIVNITKVAYPMSLSSSGGSITFTYRVTNPGIIPLSKVVITDNKCDSMSGKLGDMNSNNLLDTNEVWTYTCTANLKETTTNIATVTAFANGMKAIGTATVTIVVDALHATSSPDLPDTGKTKKEGYDTKILVWEILSGILAVLAFFFILSRKNK
jgi:hypothetical protein